MLLKDHFIGSFYDVVKAEHPLVLVNIDVDAICASMILCDIFASDDIHYTVAYVDSPEMLEAKLQDLKGKIKNVILINCYGHLSLDDSELLDGELKFYIIDSRRPFHLDNIFSTNVSILAFSQEISSWNLPSIDQIYMESDSSDAEEDEEARHLMVESRIIKRAAKDEWSRNRANIQFEYYCRSWYSLPSAVMLLEIAHSLGKSHANAAWCAAVGLSSQYIDNLISSEQYLEVCMEHMRQHIARFAPRGSQRSSDDVMNISFNDELVLPLYRKWNLYSSLTHDITVSCSHALWSQKGETALKNTLAALGITLAECRASFDSLQTEDRERIFKILLKYMDTQFATFFAEYGYNQRFSSVDFARILAAKLELNVGHHPSSSSSTSPSQEILKRVESAKALLYSFFRNNGHDTVITPALDLYKKGLDAVRGLVFNALHHSLVTAAADNFFILTLDPATDIQYLYSRHFLNLFVQFVLTGFISMKNTKKRATKPLLILIPSMMNDENNRYWIVTGSMPFIDIARQTERKSLLPYAFRKVTDAKHIPVHRDLFDPNILRIRDEDKVRFIESLDMMLQN